MAPAKTSKRKRPRTTTTPRKKPRYIETSRDSSTSPQQEQSGVFWSAESILNERKNQYLIAWAGTDPTTNKPYPPTWEPKRNANNLLVADWEAKKAAKKTAPVAAKAKAAPTPEKNGIARPSHGGPQSRVVESSSASSTPAPLRNNTPSQAAAISNGPNTLVPLPKRPVAIVQVKARADFDPQEFELFSQLPPSRATRLSQKSKVESLQNPSQAESLLQATEESQRAPSPKTLQVDLLNLVSPTTPEGPELSSSHSLAPRSPPRGFWSSGVVPDSQSLPDSVSYQPSTQTASGSNQQQRLNQVSGTNEIQGANQEEPSSQAQVLKSDPIEATDISSQSQPQTVAQEENTLGVAYSYSQPEVPSTNQKEIQDTVEVTGTPLQSVPQRVGVGSLGVAKDPIPVVPPPTSQKEEQGSGETNNTLYPPTPQPVQHKEGNKAVEIGASSSESAPQLVNKNPENHGISTERLSPDPPANAPPGKSGHHREILGLAPQAIKGFWNISHDNSQNSIERRDFAIVSQPNPANIPAVGQDFILHSLAGYSRNLQREPTATSIASIAKEFEPGTQSPTDFHPHTQQEEEQNAQIVTPDPYLSSQEEPELREVFADSIHPTTEIDHNDGGSSTSRHDSSQESPVPSAGLLNHSSLPPRIPSHSLGTIDSCAPLRLESPTSSIPSSAENMDDGNDFREFDRRWDKVLENALKSSPLPPPKRILQTVSPAAGTRSPSTIPDRIPQPQVPTSLRTIALVKSAEAASPLVSPTVPMSRTQDDMQSEDDDSLSVLNDDLELMSEEYIVPLPMDGRQKSMYMDEVKRKEDLLKMFLQEPQDFDRLNDVEAVLQRLRAVESHVDLIYSESVSSSQTTSPFTQVQWDKENCVKFRFLSTLFDQLRESEMHFLIVLEKENDPLFDILEKFCQGKLVNYKYPARARAAKQVDVEGTLRVTMLSYESAFVVQPPEAIICLNGIFDTAQIRKKKWALNPDRAIVPIIHLVIPRSVSHIERYVSSALSSKKRLHTIVASLAQVHGDIGRAMGNSPRSHEAAELVSKFLESAEENSGQAHAEWPLPSIGSIKDVIEYQSQQSQTPINSPPVVGNSSKRPLDSEHLDPSKRMRMTPTPQATANADISHISDSMPNTAAQISILQARLEQEQQAHKQARRQKREFELTLDKRQTEFEDLNKKFRLLLGEVEVANHKVEAAKRQKENLQERFDKRTTEVEELQNKVLAQEQLLLTSEDDKVAEITRLRKEVEQANEAKKCAEKKANSEENLCNYLKEQFSNARDRATEVVEEMVAVKAERDTYKQQAESTRVDLKKLHMDNSSTHMMEQIQRQKIRISHLEKSLQQKDEEAMRFKYSKGVGMGTRAASVPRSPRVGAGGATSRAASPFTGHRVSNLRNG
ncbi:uncharacterized protein BDR25DRAFT_308134 [Lindgomyces ingoldianus]|uniref:Uncharacterized protein n=1 Tax=Lindgomyces ingoldianus TaxID=673940 RepID=A0ACB6Q9E0_9PLEO|nr:uncharacterized protein BDR25DRAFT_308134 [Lindgomyces ingoldianus]KAF2462755.1 hypothetical protein BDR25DRAFT_308134 [Lindgomyces ingoldianus]